MKKESSMKTATPPDAVQSLEPKNVWHIFSEMSGVPRPSKQEQRICAHVKSVAEQHGLTVREDSAGNLVIQVPASPGCAGAPIVVLQSHLDMVCEKNGDVQHDFDNDPIRLLVDTDATNNEQIVRADGTTLGADNGIGVAMALAAATSPDAVHGPLELLCTTDEEAGMTGAKSLTPGSFHGRILLNLDSEEDDSIYIGCAGGCDSTLTWTPKAAGSPASGSEWCQIRVTGLRGGHSGGDIHENRANAIRLLAAALRNAPAGTLRLVRITGGSKRNAIPREAQVVVAGPAGTLDALKVGATRYQEEAATAHGEPNASIAVERIEADSSAIALSSSETDQVLAALLDLPNGVLGMSEAVPGLVETSNNVSIVQSTQQDGRVGIELCTLSPSSSTARLRETLDRIAEVAGRCGAAVETGNDYPGWDPNPNSPVLALCRRVYQKEFGCEPKVAAIHAGLECGLIGDRVGGMDMVSFGPTILGAHSPDERVFVASVQKSWRFLLSVLRAFTE